MHTHLDNSTITIDLTKVTTLTPPPLANFYSNISPTCPARIKQRDLPHLSELLVGQMLQEL